MNQKQLKLFGFRVRQKRIDLKLEKDAVAALLEVHPRTYVKWENGESEPTLGKAMALANILQTTLSELVDEGASPKVTNSFNNNNQEGENCTIQNQIITLDREVMQEINQRFAFLEQTILLERTEKARLLDLVLNKLQAPAA
jgi:DNA-binding XRE family transcriptional regulator